VLEKCSVYPTLVSGLGGLEPPTSTMSWPIGRTKTRVDASLMEKCVLENWYRAESPLSIVVEVRGDVDLLGVILCRASVLR